MTEKEILEGNKLIAEFMGYPYSAENCHEFIGGPITGETIKHGLVFSKSRDNFYTNRYGLNMCRGSDNIFNPKYHSSWDWLMPVVEKINNIQWHTDMDGDEFLPGEQIIQCIKIALGCVDIESAFDNIIRFIKWCNTQKQTP